MSRKIKSFLIYDSEFANERRKAFNKYFYKKIYGLAEMNQLNGRAKHYLNLRLPA